MFFRKQFCMHASHEQMCNPKSESKKIKTLIVNEYSSKSLVCLLLDSIVPLENFSLTWSRHHYRRGAAKFDLCLALMAIEQ